MEPRAIREAPPLRFAETFQLIPAHAVANDERGALAVEHARYGVTANAILPGWIETDMTAGLTANEKFVAATMPRIPMRRFGKPEDFGGIAVYLMSALSSYHTGDCLLIDGGYSKF